MDFNKIFNNKWLRGAIPALLIHCSIGSVYAWSLFVNPISEYINKPTSAIQISFSLAIFFLGMSAAFFGGVVEKNIKRSSLIAVICFCSGLLVAALAMRLKSLLLLYLGYGCLMGIGLGIGYLSPVKSLMMWFSDRKGLATGIAIMGFGLASSMASPIITYLTSHFTLEKTFAIMALIYFVPMILAQILIRKPYDDYSAQEVKFDVKKTLKNKTFVFIWLMFFLNIHCGLALISTAAPLLIEKGVSVTLAATIVGVMGIFNAGGRLSFAAASDYARDRIIIYRIIFGLAIVSTICGIILGVQLGNAMVLMALLCIISIGYGAGFSTLPALLSDRFNMGIISRVHGLCLSAWGVAGLTGNLMASLINDAIGNYASVLYALVVLYALAYYFSTKIKVVSEITEEDISEKVKSSMHTT